MARVLRPRMPRYPSHPRTEPPELLLKVLPESPKSSPRSSPVSSPSGYLTSTLGGPFWTKGSKGSKGEHKVPLSPGPGDYSPEDPGIRGRIPGRVPGFPEKPNAARCNQPGLGVLLPLDAVDAVDAVDGPKSARQQSKSRRSRDRGCLALTPRMPKGPKGRILRLNDKPTVITYHPWSPGHRKF